MSRRGVADRSHCRGSNWKSDSLECGGLTQDYRVTAGDLTQINVVPTSVGNDDAVLLLSLNLRPLYAAFSFDLAKAASENVRRCRNSIRGLWRGLDPNRRNGLKLGPVQTPYHRWQNVDVAGMATIPSALDCLGVFSQAKLILIKVPIDAL